MNAKRYSKPVYRVLLVLSAALLAFSMMFSHVPVSAPAKAETTVAADINAITDGSVYRLTEDMTDDLTINADANVRIDLAGHIMSGKIVNNGTLVLIDSEGSGGVIRENINVETNLVTNKGDLTVDGAKISAVGTKVIRTIDNQAGAVLRVESGEISSQTGEGNPFCFAVNNSGTALINGGALSARAVHSTGGNILAVNNSGTLTISGGELRSYTDGNGVSACVRNNGGANVSVSGGSLYAEVSGGTMYAAAIFNQGGGTVTSVSGGTLTAKSVAGDGTNPLAFGIDNVGTIRSVSGGVIHGINDARDFTFGIRNQGAGVIEEISGGVIIAEISNTVGGNSVAVASDGNFKKLSGGTLYAVKNHNIGYTAGARIRNHPLTVSGGAVYSGANANHLMKDNDGGVINFESGYSLSDASQETGYRYVLPADGGFDEEYAAESDVLMTGKTFDAENALLKEYILYGTDRYFVSIGENKYTSFKAALDAAVAGDTLKLLKNTKEDVRVAAGKNIAIDLAGHSVEGTLTNDGSLVLGDSAGAGRIFGSFTENKELIVNGGTLSITGGGYYAEGNGDVTFAALDNKAGATLSVSGGTVRSVAYGSAAARGIVNAGTLENISGGSISALSFGAESVADTFALSNTGEGVVSAVSGGAVYAQSNGKNTVAAICNAGASVAEITGGTVKAVSSGASGANAYALYNRSGNIGEIAGGALTATALGGAKAAAVFTAAEIESISGGKARASAVAEASALLIGEGGSVAEIAGGYFEATSCAVKNDGDIEALVCGVFLAPEYVVGGGTTVYKSGVSLKAVGGDVKYAAHDNAVIVEQTDDKGEFIGVDIYSDKALSYHYDEYERKGLRLCAFKNNGEEIMQSEFSELESSTTVVGEYTSAPVYYFLGSSVTYGHANNGSSFVNEIGNALNCICVKEAVSGTTLATLNKKGVYQKQSYVARMERLISKDVHIDHLIVQLSTNDVSNELTLGAVTADGVTDKAAFDTGTVLGAIEYIIAYARETWGCEVTFYTNPPYGNASYESLVTKLGEVKAKWGIGVVDFYNYRDMTALDAATLASYMSDPIHPNAAGYKWMGKVFVDYLSADKK